ncbi:DegT/DnrJ/EryC1/StrS family aminotransferase [Paenibacillus marinisediminis]
MNIPLFVPTYRVDECLTEIRECLETGWTGFGYKTIAFEEEWKQYTGFPYAHFVNSASAGLSIAIEVLKMTNGWKRSDEIITTPLTFVSTNHAIRYHELKPVFADVDEYLCLDPDDVERRITPRTRAVIFVGIGGNTGQYERIAQLCKDYRISLILDAAHMAGTRLNGAIPGHEADAVVYSFQAVKNLPTADSGMICLQHAEQDRLARKLSWLGINKNTFSKAEQDIAYSRLYDVEHVGTKSHGNSIMAAIGIVQLRYLDQDNAYRKQLAEWYEAALEPLSSNVRIIPSAPGCDNARHLFIVRISERDKLIQALNEQGIYPGVHFRSNTEYRMYRHARGQCPQAEALSKEILSLPLHLRMTNEDVQAVVEGIKQFIQRDL